MGLTWQQRRDLKVSKLTEAQKTTYLVIEEYWKRFGFGPTVDDVMRLTGEKSRSNVSRKMWKLVDLGLCKGTRRRARSIRPAYMKVWEIE